MGAANDGKSSVREVCISGSFGHLEVVLLPSLSKIMGSGTCKFGSVGSILKTIKILFSHVCLFLGSEVAA